MTPRGPMLDAADPARAPRTAEERRADAGPARELARPGASPQPLRVRTVLRLQATAGNAAVAGMLRRPRRAPSVPRPAPSSRHTPGSRPGAGATGHGIGPRAGGPPAGTVGLGAVGGIGSAGAVGGVGADVLGPTPGDPRLELVQREAAGADYPPPVPPGPPTPPDQDPKFAAVKAEIAAKGKAAKAHPAPKAEARKAQDAAVPPADHKAAQAKAMQADKMAAAKPKGFDKAAFIAAVKKAIAAAAPKNLDEADKFASSGKADAIKPEVMAKVDKGREDSAKEVADTTAAPPDASRAVDKPVKPLATAAPAKPSDPKAGRAMPAKAPKEQLDLGSGKARTDAMMAEADVTEEQLSKANEPKFAEAVKAKKEGEAHSVAAPPAVREDEAKTLDASKAGAQAEGTQAMAALGLDKVKAVQAVGSQKSAAKSKDEAERANVTAQITRYYEDTKRDVEKILTDLDGKVETAFDTGEADAKAAFTTEHTTGMERYKDERYSGPDGWARWVADLFKGLPPEANRIYEKAKAVYEQKMETVISRVADLIGGELTRAKDRIAEGRSKIKTYVAGLPVGLRKVGTEAAQAISDKFDQLSADVDEKQNDLVNDLADKYVEARDKVDAEISDMQAENRGLWDKAKEAVGGVIETIKKLREMLLGVLARAAGAVDKIIKDPIGFLGNLVRAVKAGVMGFKNNILTHLKKGLMTWLFGEAAKAGIEMPKTFDLKGIIGLILQLLGLTYANLRARAVALVGEKVVAGMEKAFEFFKILATEGPAGLWKYLKDKLADIKEQFIGGIRDFVIQKIVVAGIMWLVSMLNPASAFVKACKAIVDVVMFLVNKAGQIKEFVDSVLDSVESIAGGGAGGIPAKIEATLGRMVPILIGFLASLLGVGGISEKIKSIIATIQKPVNSAIDAVLKPLARMGKKMFGKAKSWVKGKVEKGKAWVKGKVEKGKAWVKGKVEAGKKWVKGKAETSVAWIRQQIAALKSLVLRQSFKVGDESHSVFTEKGNPNVVYLASEKKPISAAGLGAELDGLNGQYKGIMAQYWALLSRMTGTASDAALIRQAGKFKSQGAKLIRQMAAAARKAMDAGQAPGAHAPNIGDVGPHSKQQSRLRPKKDGKNVPAWRMESEHVIPREVISGAFEVIPLQGAEITNAEYNGMTTVLMYEQASKQKTHGGSGDLAVIRGLKARVRMQIEQAFRSKDPAALRDALGEAGAEAMKAINAAGSGAAGRAKAAIKAEQGKVGDDRGKGATPRPGDGEVDAAAKAQGGQVEAFFHARMAEVERRREEDAV